ncbi:MAG TPA: VOC family protein [Planctomycetota bacterium]|nr:VOC family protein [Planctomycetota bacterium]
MSELNSKHNRCVWFDIPVRDLERADKFYAAVLGIEVSIEDFGGFRFAVLEHDEGNGGCLVPRPEWIAPGQGVLVYLNAEGRLRDAVAKASTHGGQVLEAIEPIGPHGFRAVLQDSEGNRIALHSSTDA